MYDTEFKEKTETDYYGESTIISTHRQSKWKSFKESFKRAESLRFSNNPNLTDVEKTALATSQSPLNKSLKSRHLQMIAIGGSIGTGLFVGSGSSLSEGGPASVIIAYAIIGSMLFVTVHALGELAVRFPVAGAFSTYSTRFIDPAWGFAMGWNYALQWLVVFPLELVAASLTISYWKSDNNAATNVNPDAWVALFWGVIVMINLFGVKGYGEAEFLFSICKVLAVCGFIILGIILICGGGSANGYIGAKYWYNPGAFKNGFKGLCSVFVTAAFAFGGTELVGLAAAESENPKKDLPSATKQVFWRITLFYIVSLLLVGLLVPFNDPQLLNASSSADAAASPFVICIKNAGIKGLPSVMNVVILISVLSVGNSSIYACSRTLCALAAQGQAPKIFNYIDNSGRPLAGIIVTSLVGLLCFLAGSDKRTIVFNWMLSISGVSSLFTWGSICLCHIRFRRAMDIQNRSINELSFQAAFGIWGSYYGLLLILLVSIAQFWTALFPHGKPDTESFFRTWLCLPLAFFCYIWYKFRHRTAFVCCKSMDLVSGIRELDMDFLRQEAEEERLYLKSREWWYRTYKFWC